MDQQKVGKFLKELRHEKEMTQEQLAQHFNVSSRTISRWETGSNLPDISLLVEIADFYDVDVREIIDGGRKSEMMNDDVREVADKMANYANKEKSQLLTYIQAIAFAGVLISVVSIILQTRKAEMEFLDKGVLFLSVISFAAAAIITLYVTGLLGKLVKHKAFIIAVRVLTIILIVFGAGRVLVFGFAIGILWFDVAFSRPEIHEDVGNYRQYMSFNYEEGADTIWRKCGMDETIWPHDITEDMNVADYKMIYYNPWDAQYLGYLVVDYDDEAYAKEVERLKAYESTEYIGYYSVTEETTYDLLAINADDYQGFVYALTDGNGRIIYAEEIFCNYFMDLQYWKYMPKEYLLDGFDATQNNPVAVERRKQIGG